MEYWTDEGLCDNCGELTMVVRFQNSEMEDNEITCRLCEECIMEMLYELE